jgi:hypothetical protein
MMPLLDATKDDLSLKLCSRQASGGLEALRCRGLVIPWTQIVVSIRLEVDKIGHWGVKFCSVVFPGSAQCRGQHVASCRTIECLQ